MADSNNNMPLRVQRSIEANTTHGHNSGGKKTREYAAWDNMKRRCLNPQHPEYFRYGGRGISFAESLTTFEGFLSELGTCPPGGTLDRIDTNGDYEPGNVRWASRKQQARNMRSNHLLTSDGRTQCISAWAEELGISKYTIWTRIRLKWPPEFLLIAAGSSRRKDDSGNQTSV